MNKYYMNEYMNYCNLFLYYVYVLLFFYGVEEEIVYVFFFYCNYILF